MTVAAGDCEQPIKTLAAPNCRRQSHAALAISRRATLDEKLEYFHLNPVRHRLMERDIDWKWNSARWYDWRKTVGMPTHRVA